MSEGMSQPPLSQPPTSLPPPTSAAVGTPGTVGEPPAVATSISGEAGLPLGRPVRRRIAVPLMLAVGIAVVVALLTLHDTVVYYRVASGSMEPTLAIGARVAVEPGLTPTVGEIIVFHPPVGAIPATPVCAAPGQGAGFPQPCAVATAGSSRAVFIKRIVAGPGDALQIQSGRAVVNGVTQSEPFAALCGGSNCNFSTPVRVPARHYYVLGDNRGASDDSRFWGPVPASSVIGVLVSCGPLQTDCQPRH